MNLIDLYIGEVTRRLPEKNRADIALELHSAIEDMLPEDPSEEEIKTALAEMGDPAVLASGYNDRPMHLIGPRYFEMYLSLLKLIVPIAVMVTLIVLVITTIFSNAGDATVGDAAASLVGDAISAAIATAVQVFAWLTLVFAVIERFDRSASQKPLTAASKEWTPDDLKEVAHIPKEKMISKYEIIGALIWTAIWSAGYFYADRLVGIYLDRGDGLELTAPAFNQEVLLSYWPLVVLAIILQIMLAAYKWREGQWTQRVAVLNAVVQAVYVGTVILIFTNPNLINQGFLDEMAAVFGGTSGLNWIIGSILLIAVIAAVSDSYQGFRRARIPSENRVERAV